MYLAMGRGFLFSKAKNETKARANKTYKQYFVEGMAKNFTWLWATNNDLGRPIRSHSGKHLWSFKKEY